MFKKINVWQKYQQDQGDLESLYKLNLANCFSLYFIQIDQNSQ